MTIILGAGLSGLIAATQFPTAQVLEANGPAALSHKAVLRFRSDSLSRLTGIPFRQVTVRKSIWHDEMHCLPDIQLANYYSRKTNGGYLDRSIWNLDPVQRFIAPENLQEQMAAAIGDRIKWHHRVSSEELAQLPHPIISTLPMPVIMNLMGITTEDAEFNYSGIVVDRYRVHGANVFQTIYYPEPSVATYRASITGDLLIRERTGMNEDMSLPELCYSFGIDPTSVELIDESHAQRFGKISPIDDRWRRQFIWELSHKTGVYSVGRFATWRNILLDDVVDDVNIVKRLITQGSYGAALLHSSSTSH